MCTYIYIYLNMYIHLQNGQPEFFRILRVRIVRFHIAGVFSSDLSRAFVPTSLEPIQPISYEWRFPAGESFV